MFLALRELKHSKMRYLLIALIMILIAWLVLFVSGLAKGLSSDNASSIQNMNADYLVLQKDSDNRMNRSVLSKDKLDDVHHYVKGQSAVPLGIQMTTLTKKGSAKKVDVAYFALNVDSMLAPDVVEGKMISNTTKDEVVADKSLKEKGLELGDTVKDQTSGKSFKIAGFTKGQSYSHAPVIHMNFKEWSAINKGKAQSQSAFNVIALKADQDQADKIEKNVSGVDVITKDQALKGIPGYQEEQGSLIMMIAFLFVIAAFVLAIFFYVITIQKMSQFGVLKAIGAKTGYLARNIISQVLLLTVISLIISIALTYGVAFILPSSMPFDLSPMLVLGSSGLFLLVAVLGSLLSLYRVAKVDAIEAIGGGA